jgi:multidrug efflux pump subunit AcrA (membrane-fusion protein)
MKAGRLGARLGVLAVVVAAGVWAVYANVGGRGGGMDMSARVTGSGRPFPVTVAAAESGPMGGSVTYTGGVAPFNEEDIYPRVTGRIVEMTVYPGDAVRAGQVVARLDDVELGSRVVEAEAGRATAQANRTQMEADLVAAQHGIVQMERELAMVAAELTYARGVTSRGERLVKSGAISQQEFESDRSMAASLEAKQQAARAKLEQARAMEASARGKLEASASMVAKAEAEARTARVVRDYVTIVAPSAGYVVKRIVAPGVLVQPGMPILKITQVDRVRLQANVGEKDLASIRVGAPVRVTTTASGAAPIEARVTSVFPFVDPGARTAVVEAVVDNPGRRLVPGQYVTMQFTTGLRAKAVSVPRSAVARLGGKATVWVVEGDRVEPREVLLGLEDSERVEVTRGLAAGEHVVARGHEGLYADARVRAVMAGGSAVRAPAGKPDPMPGMDMPAAGPKKPTVAPDADDPAKGGKHGGH